jgi:hypothetical protein
MLSASVLQRAQELIDTSWVSVFVQVGRVKSRGRQLTELRQYRVSSPAVSYMSRRCVALNRLDRERLHPAAILWRAGGPPMRLLIAWVTSALAGALAFSLAVTISAPIAKWLMYGHPPQWDDLLFLFRIVPGAAYAYAFVMLLIFQLAYGGLLYLVLRRLSLFNLPWVLLAYLAPVAVIALTWSAAPKVANAIPMLTAGTTLAVVGWFLARSPKT